VRFGEYQTLRVTRETQHGIYLADSNKVEVLLPRGQCPDIRVGDTLRVFVLTDSEDRPIATTKTPKATVGEFAYLQVVSATDSGAFLDWGLDKDLFCPHREQQIPMREGSRYLVRIYFDEVSSRVVCTSKLSRFLQPDGEGLKPGQPVKIMIASKSPDLVSVIIDGKLKGSLFPDEWQDGLAIGEVRDGFVKSVRAEDKKVAVSLRPQGFRAILGERDRLLDALRSNGGSLAVSDKSPPEEIQRLFGLSKGAFKRLIGALYKEGVIVIEPDGIRLAK
jgi:predicted RNA-binding protein (virulence factor B family)